MNSYYQEKLRSDEWRFKRLLILKRDGYQCTKCRNQYYLDNFKEGKILNIKESRSALADFMLSHPNFLWHQYDIVYSTDNNSEEKVINTDIELPDLNSLGEVVILISSKVEGIYSRDGDFNCTWHYARNLEVHHSFYDKSKEPWEYPNDSLITLCTECHKRIHKECEIPKW